MGARGVATADVVHKLRANSQLQHAVQTHFVKDLPHVKHYPAGSF